MRLQNDNILEYLRKIHRLIERGNSQRMEERQEEMAITLPLVTKDEVERAEGIVRKGKSFNDMVSVTLKCENFKEVSVQMSFKVVSVQMSDTIFNNPILQRKRLSKLGGCSSTVNIRMIMEEIMDRKLAFVNYPSCK